MEKELKICGVDEAGRGPLAGPVFAAAVVLNKQNIPQGLKDSKKLSEKARRALYQQICKDADDFGESFEALQVVDPTRPRKPNNRTAKYLRTKKGFFTPQAP